MIVKQGERIGENNQMNGRRMNGKTQTEERKRSKEVG
jgi:hypothetical protein